MSWSPCSQEVLKWLNLLWSIRAQVMSCDSWEWIPENSLLQWRDFCSSPGRWGNFETWMCLQCDTTHPATWDFICLPRATVILSLLNMLSPFPRPFPVIFKALHCGVTLGSVLQLVSLLCQYTFWDHCQYPQSSITYLSSVIIIIYQSIWLYFCHHLYLPPVSVCLPICKSSMYTHTYTHTHKYRHTQTYIHTQPLSGHHTSSPNHKDTSNGMFYLFSKLSSLKIQNN
jgi:hypothetical protein